MNRKYLFLMFALFTCVGVYAQPGIEECYEKARANYPQIKQYDLISKAQEYNLSNANKGYLPQVMFSAKASYQSAVTTVPLAGAPKLSKDQYSAALDINQVIWDGGTIRSKKEGIRTSSEVDSRSLEVDLYDLRQRVNQLYFGILLFDAQIDLNRLFQEELQRNYDKVAAYISGGVANKADLDAVKVEQLQAIQTESQLKHNKGAYVEMLSAMIGEQLSPDVALVRPAEAVDMNAAIRRPELELFEAQMKNLEARNREINAGLMPKISLYATGGYGRPGLDMLKNNLSLYGTGGIRLSWNIGSFYTNKDSKRLINNSIGSIKANEETFLFNTNMDISKKQSEIEKYRDQLQYDDEIIDLRASVKRASEAKMEHGTLSGIDLMRDVNAEQSARQDKVLHEIELLQSIYNLKFITNE